MREITRPRGSARAFIGGCTDGGGGQKGEGVMKKTILSILAVFFAWSVMDFVIHGVILKASYEATAHLWRPMAEMKMGLMHVVVFIAASVFVLIYAWLIGGKSLARGLKYGLLYGLAAGVSMGYGSYSYMPITYHIALVWFLGSLVEMTVAGLIVGAIIKE